MKTFALAACLLVASAGMTCFAQPDAVKTSSASALPTNPDAPRILNDYACVKVCGGTRSSCDPAVYENANGRCS